jgi:hypothetical protein
VHTKTKLLGIVTMGSKEKAQQMETRINNSIMKRLARLLVPFVTVGALTVAAQANDREGKASSGHCEQVIHQGHGGHADHGLTTIEGKGTADMAASADTFIPLNGIPTADLAYPINTEFESNRFAMKANVHADGGVTGTARFVFGDEFASAWGADAMTLECEIGTGFVIEDGTIFLRGSSFEEDFDEFGNVIFEELSPCEIIIDSAGSFSLRWCATPALNVEITKGHLKVK